MEQTRQEAKKTIAIFTGNANPQMANDICNYLGITLGGAKVKKFSDGEIQIELNDSVRGMDAFVVQPTCFPVNDNLMELLLMIDAMKRSSALRITAVLPYFGYARQDKKVAPRVPISAKLVADMLQVAGADRIITMELHARQIQGFFNSPVDNLIFGPILYKHLKKNFSAEKIVIVSPDAGGVERARVLAKALKAGLAIIDKRRPAPGVANVMNIIGKVEGMICVLIDDMVDSAGSIKEAAEALNNAGATEIHACACHAVLSGPAIGRIEDSPLKSVIFSNTIPLSEQAKFCSKITQLSVSEMIGEAIIRSITKESVTCLFNYETEEA